MNNKKISIIVPVYNVEAYLNKCMDSLVNQTYRDIEIILINDGSSDNSGTICDRWKEKDTRIKVVHQQNMGAGAARNAGLSLAKGDFIAFVDSDDYVSLNMYEFLMECFDENIDIVECDYISVYDDLADFDRMEIEPKKVTVSSEEALRENINDHFFRQLIWNKVYKREILEGIMFPTGKKIDDEFWTYQVLGNANKLLHSPKVMYAYRQQENSVMHSMSPVKRLQAIEAKVRRHNYVCEKYPNLVDISLCNLWFTCMYQTQNAMKVMEPSDYEKARKEIKSVLKKYPLTLCKQKEIGLKQRIWLFFANLSFEGTCLLRNLLKIGL